jgi:hemerythrin superfamily protein
MDEDQGDALELLTEQHDLVDALIEMVESSDDDEEKAAAFRELANQLAAHAAMEERLFYPFVLAKQTEPLLRQSTEEHLAVKRVLADLIELDLDDPQFAAKLAVMKEELRHHEHDEEEDVLFPIVRRMASKEELLALGGEMLALFEAILGTEPSDRVALETDQAAPL